MKNKVTKNQVCVAIPIYKISLDSYEQQSIKQCFKVLGEYDIYFLAPNSLDLKWYRDTLGFEFSIIRFEDFFFRNLTTYNKLMLNVQFYESFQQYEYMLIYQPDCYVFKDALLEWAQKDYDYIGAVWFDGYHGIPDEGARPWYAGNGGLSLRKIQKMISVLTSTKPAMGIRGVIGNMPLFNEVSFSRFVWEWFQLPIKLLGHKNNTKYFAVKHTKNEDVFFMEVNKTYGQLNVPEVNETLLFGWDRCASFLYKKIRQLPFACHGWYRSEFPYEGNKDFWMKHIDINEEKH